MSAYLLTPLVAWFFAASLKWLILCITHQSIKVSFTKYGGFPSIHSAIVMSVVFIVAFREGTDCAAFAVSLALAMIVMIDAYHLRRQIGHHASRINALTKTPQDESPLVETVGHSLIEIAGGIAIGFFAAWMFWACPYFNS